jgi:hypothetical protein
MRLSFAEKLTMTAFVAMGAVQSGDAQTLPTVGRALS